MKQTKILEAIRLRDDRKVFEMLYKSYLPMVKNIVYKYNGSVEDAKDVFQDTLMVLIREVDHGRVDEAKNLDNFIYTIAKNLYINKLLKQNKQVDIEQVKEDSKIEQQAVDIHLSMKDGEQLILDTIKQLGDTCYELLKAIIFENMKQEAIAERLGLGDRHVVKTYKNRCKNKLINLLKSNPALSMKFIASNGQFAKYIHIN